MASHMKPRGFLSVFFVLILLNPVTLVAQGLPQSPYSAASAVRGGIDLAPSNPLATPAGGGAPGMGSVLLTPQMFRGILPQPANLQAGYLYSFGESVGSGRLTLDFAQPVVFGNSAVFGEAHSAFQDFWETVTGGANNRVDLSFGGGYRTLLNDNTLLGVNGFFDSTKLGGRWYSSGSVGCEMAALIAGSDAIDLSFNWYGNLFNSDVLANAFRRGPQNYDFQAGYSHELWNGGPDLRLFGTGYRFSAGSGVYGIRGGVELKSRDGMFSFKYEAANDRVNQTYHTVGGFVNVGVQLSNLLNGESPFVAPEPIFRSPRNLRRLLSQPAHQRLGSSQPGSIFLARVGVGAGAAPCVNPTGGLGPIGVVGQSPEQTIFVPFPGGCEYDRDYWLNAGSVQVTGNYAFANMGSCTTPGLTVARLSLYWASSATDYAASTFIYTWRSVDTARSIANTMTPSDALTPKGPVRGIVVVLGGCPTAQISVDLETSVAP